MPKSPKSYLKQPQLPLEVKISGDAFDVIGSVPATVPVPNDVIITNIEGAYTEVDRKLWAFLVMAVWDELGTKTIHEVKVSKINEAFQIANNGNNQSCSWIWESAKRLINTRVTWESAKEKERLQGCSVLLSGALTHKNARLSGWLKFGFDGLLADVIKRPCYFSRLRLHFMIGLSGKYAVSLYMLLETVANLQTSVLDIDLMQLRQYLKIPEGKLERWVDIRRFILEPALKQINEKPAMSGFTVEMEVKKDGRAVDRVRFVVTKSPQRIAEEKQLKQEQAKKHSEEINHIALKPSAIEEAKKHAQGWDIYYLEQEWRAWIADKQVNSPDASFIGFCKKKGIHPHHR